MVYVCERERIFKELPYMIVGVGKSEFYRGGCRMEI